jgi:hypothetical protein
LSLINEVKKLQELDSRAVGGTWTWYAMHDGPEFESNGENFNPQMPGVDIDLVVALRNAAPDLLDILSGFRIGDEEKIRSIKNHLETVPKIAPDILECISRIHQMTLKMERDDKI